MHRSLVLLEAGSALDPRSDPVRNRVKILGRIRMKRITGRKSDVIGNLIEDSAFSLPLPGHPRHGTLLSAYIAGGPAGLLLRGRRGSPGSPCQRFAPMYI